MNSQGNQSASSNTERSVLIYTVQTLVIVVDFSLLYREFELVRASMNSAISMNKTEVLDAVLNDFSAVNFVTNCIVRVLWWNFGVSILVMKLIM
jgi:hypothetical protein